MISEAKDAEAEPCKSDLADDFDLKTSCEQRIQSLVGDQERYVKMYWSLINQLQLWVHLFVQERESALMKERNEKLTTEVWYSSSFSQFNLLFCTVKTAWSRNFKNSLSIITFQLKTLQQERDEDKINLSNFREELQTLEVKPQIWNIRFFFFAQCFHPLF